MRPTDVLAHKRIMHDWTGDMIRSAEVINATDALPAVIHDVHDACLSGDAYFVTADMAAVAKAAAETMPSQTLDRDDLPSANGFLLYDQPVAEWRGSDDAPTERVVGFAWSLSELLPYWSSGEGGRLIGPADHDEQEPPTGYEQRVEIAPLGRSAISTMPLMPLSSIEFGMSWPIGDEPVNDDSDLGPVLLATWTLMQQSLTVSQRTNVDRPERRRSARSGLVSDVMVVRLRRRHLDAESPNAPGGEASWSHRWLVSGHWRNQWLPSRASHRLQWISGYVKGPANLPLVVKDRVTAWVR